MQDPWDAGYGFDDNFGADGNFSWDAAAPESSGGVSEREITVDSTDAVELDVVEEEPEAEQAKEESESEEEQEQFKVEEVAPATRKADDMYYTLSEEQKSDVRTLVAALLPVARDRVSRRDGAGLSLTLAAPVQVVARIPQLPRIKVTGKMYYRILGEGPVEGNMLRVAQALRVASIGLVVVGTVMLCLRLFTGSTYPVVLVYLGAALCFLLLAVLVRRPFYENVTSQMQLKFAQGDMKPVTMAEDKKASATTPGMDVFVARTRATHRDSAAFEAAVLAPRLGSGVTIGPLLKKSGPAMVIPLAASKNAGAAPTLVTGTIDVLDRDSLPFAAKHKVLVRFPNSGSTEQWQDLADRDLQGAELEWQQGQVSLDLYRLSKVSAGAWIDSVSGVPVVRSESEGMSYASATDKASWAWAKSTTAYVSVDGAHVVKITGRRWTTTHKRTRGTGDTRGNGDYKLRENERETYRIKHKKIEAVVVGLPASGDVGATFSFKVQADQEHGKPGLIVSDNGSVTGTEHEQLQWAERGFFLRFSIGFPPAFSVCVANAIFAVDQRV